MKLFQGITDRWDEYAKLFPDEAPTNPTEILSDVFTVSRWSSPHGWVLRQVEEVFCDLVGVRVFGPAYLWSFSYLLAPGPQKRSTTIYPTLRQRALYMIAGARQWGYETPAEYENLFEEALSSDYSAQQQFFICVSDWVTDELFSMLWNDVERILAGKDVPLVADHRVAEVKECFRLLVPAPSHTDLSSILNAGWEAYQDASLWSEYEGIRSRRAEVLNELLLKSAQVIEVASLVGAGE